MQILIEKEKRRLTLLDVAGKILFSADIALGSHPQGPKQRAGDGRTPEGAYFVCIKKMGKYGPSLGVSYPSAADARRAGADASMRMGKGYSFRKRKFSVEFPTAASTPMGR